MLGMSPRRIGREDLSLPMALDCRAGSIRTALAVLLVKVGAVELGKRPSRARLVFYSHKTVWQCTGACLRINSFSSVPPHLCPLLRPQ